MDWPPIGSVLFPGRGNVRWDREEDIGFQVSNIPPAPLWIDRITYVTKTEGEGTDDPILCDQDALSPFQESEPVLERGTLF
jgi:hypothetical protein